MKKMLLFLFFLLSASCHPQNNAENLEGEITKTPAVLPLDVYVNDPDINGTNIRKEPNGKIILTLRQETYYMLEIAESNAGWFKVISITDLENDTTEIPDGEAWVHASVLAAETRKYLNLLDAPITGTIIGHIDGETSIGIKDRQSNWMKIEFNGTSGWVETKWLCGNPFTTCPLDHNE